MPRHVYHSIKQRMTALTTVLASASMIACTGGQSGISVSGSSSGGAGALGSISAKTFKQVLGSGYAVVGFPSQTIVLNKSFGETVQTVSSSNIEVTGSCARGVSKIIVRAQKTAGTGSGATIHDLTTDLNCTGDNFTWTPSAAIETAFGVSAEGTWDLTFVPVDGFGNEQESLGGVITVEIDQTPPAAASSPVLNGNSCPGAVWTSCSAIYNSPIAGPHLVVTVPTTVYLVRLTGGTGTEDNSNYTDGQVDFTLSLLAGDNLTYTVRTYDALGNTSGQLTANVSFSSPLSCTTENGGPCSPMTLTTTSMTLGTYGASSTGDTSLSVRRVNAESVNASEQTSTGDTSLTGQTGKVPYLIGL